MQYQPIISLLSVVSLGDVGGAAIWWGHVVLDDQPGDAIFQNGHLTSGLGWQDGQAVRTLASKLSRLGVWIPTQL